MRFLLPTQLALSPRTRAVVERVQIPLYKPPPRPFDRGDSHLKGGRNLFICQPFIGLQQDTRTDQFPRTAFASLQQLLQSLSFLGGEIHAILLPCHEPSSAS
jgi:hypothetical protein